MTEDQTIHHKPFGSWQETFKLDEGLSDRHMIMLDVPRLNAMVDVAVIGSTIETTIYVRQPEGFVLVRDMATVDTTVTEPPTVALAETPVRLALWHFALIVVMAFSIGVTAAQIAPL